MRVPIAWLRSYCDPGLAAEQLAERLTLTGTELERIERVGVGDAASLVVGKVTSVKPHPNADRLTVCEVDDGEGIRTIVCGAPNVAAGETVAVGRPGAVLADGATLQRTELRGVESAGMILAEDELGIGEDHEGILVLPDELPAGAPLSDHLPIADESLELEISPNRPDCMAIYGVARELHAATGAPLAEDPTTVDAEPSGPDRADDHASVEIVDHDVCLRFTARVFEEVEVGPSPPWLKQRLVAAGQRPISNVVDITNYVMLASGQPLHAFDLDRVRGRRIVVRRAEPGERLTTLDGVERDLDGEVALVCDAEGPVGIAGVMGGGGSEVSDSTSRVLMEVATWVGPNILQTSKRLGLRTEASARFERQLHPEQAIAAQRLAARLLAELCGARLVLGTLDAYPRPARPRSVRLRLDRLGRILGDEIAPDAAAGILERLGFGVERGDGELTATVPHWRDGDVRREADLIEEVARVHGLDRIPITLPARRHAVGRLTGGQRMRRRLEDALRDRGLDEVIAYSFTSRGALTALRLDPDRVLEIANPLSEEQVLMRPMLLPGLLDAAHQNAAHGRPNVALFESAHVYERHGDLTAPAGSPRGARPARERRHLAALMTETTPAGWRSAGRVADFHDARARLDALFSVAGLPYELRPEVWPFLHPGRAAEVMAGAHVVGWIGELHPLVLRRWDLEAAAAFELDVDTLLELAPEAPRYADLTSFPAVLQDIAVVVDEGVPAARVEEAVRAGAGELLGSVRPFDLYRGEQVGEGRKSLALRLEFRAPDRTLTDEEVAERRRAIESALAEIGGTLRG